MTIKENFFNFYDMLPEPYCSQSKENYDNKFVKRRISTIISNIPQAINYGFSWDISPEGEDYWDEIYHMSIEFETKWRRERILKLLQNE